MYNPVVGRWISRDPLAQSNGEPEIVYTHEYVANRMRAVLQPYGYVANDPMNRVDPSGLVANCYFTLAENIRNNCCLHCLHVALSVREHATNAQATAQAEANKLYPDTSDVNNIALRHCFTEGILTGTVGCNCARCIGTERESYQTKCQGQDWRHGRRGENNNKEGRNCAGCKGKHLVGDTPAVAKSLAAIIRCCRKKLKDGELDTRPIEGPEPPFD